MVLIRVGWRWTLTLLLAETKERIIKIVWFLKN